MFAYAHTLVLAVGRDPVLLETRSQVLQAAGYGVVQELSLEKAVASKSVSSVLSVVRFGVFV